MDYNFKGAVHYFDDDEQRTGRRQLQDGFLCSATPPKNKMLQESHWQRRQNKLAIDLTMRPRMKPLKTTEEQANDCFGDCIENKGICPEKSGIKLAIDLTMRPRMKPLKTKDNENGLSECVCVI
jgi:hypothetical protein